MATEIGLEGLTVTYTGTGAQTAYKIGGLKQGIPVKVNISVYGGSSDVFTFQEKVHIGGSFKDSLSSVSGVIKPITMSALPAEFLLNITTNTSGSITMEVGVTF